MSRDNFTQENIALAVNWWADKLVACKNSGLSEEERRDSRNRDYGLAEIFMTLSKPKVTPEQIDKFKAKLSELLAGKTPYCMGVDYGPDMNLRAALEHAEIPIANGVLPIKTNMWISERGVEVSYGYGAPIEKLSKRPAAAKEGQS
jgi:hypothetical protein